MATHKSAEKRARQTIKRNEINRARKSNVRSTSKAVLTAVAKKDVNEAQTALTKAESTLARTAQKGTIHRKTAARRTSRLAKRVNAAKKS